MADRIGFQEEDNYEEMLSHGCCYPAVHIERMRKNMSNGTETTAADKNMTNPVQAVSAAAVLPDGTGTEDRTGETGEKSPAVYVTTDISPEGLKKVYDALGRNLTGNVAVKLSTGEAGGNYYLSPDLIKNLVQGVNGTIVECNTAYGGSRSSTAMHRQVAEDHGFTAIAKVDIMDENGSMSIPVTGGKNLTEDLVGENLKNYDSMMVLSHFKGHSMGGFGGAVKTSPLASVLLRGNC